MNPVSIKRRCIYISWAVYSGTEKKNIPRILKTRCEHNRAFLLIKSSSIITQELPPL